MALTVDYIYNFALTLIKKNQAGGLKSKDFERQWNDAQGSYQDDMLGRFQARNNGKTGVNTGLIEDETVLQKLYHPHPATCQKLVLLQHQSGSNFRFLRDQEL